MKTNIIIIMIFGLLGAAATYALDSGLFTDTKQTQIKVSMQAQEEPPTQSTAGPMPSFSFADLDGQTHSSDDFKGKIIVLNFWATWCPPCIKEFPLLLEIAETYKEDLDFIALSSDFQDDALDRFVTAMKNEHPGAFEHSNVIIAKDENQHITQKIFQTFKLPETIIIDQDQQMVTKLVGANWTIEDMNEILSPLL